METVATLLSWASGFALMHHRSSPLDIAMTSAAINVALAPLVATIAARRGRSAVLWSAMGVCFGMWALIAVLVVLGSRRPNDSPAAPPPFPTSDAA